MSRLSPLRSRFFWKLAGSYAAVVVVAAVSIGWIALRHTARALEHGLEGSLARTCGLMVPRAREHLGAADGELARAALGRMESGTELRLTWIRADGSVAADTHADASRMDDHWDRPEVQSALSRPLGVARRASDTLDRRMLYVARAVEVDGHLLGVVRAAMPLAEIETELAEQRGKILAGTTVGAVLALLLGLLAARRITRPVADITRTARAVTAGDYGARVGRLPRDELGVLGQALNRLAEETGRRVARIAEEEARLRAMLAGMVEAVIAVDGSDRVVFSNAAALALFDVPRRELEGQRLWERVRVAGLGELLSEAKSSDGLVRREIGLRRDESEVVLEAHASPFRSRNGSEDGVVLVLHDITELRRLERIRRDFVANVSHELKTPLTSIQGYIETLLDGALHDTENNERFLLKAERHVQRLDHLVSDLLSLARIESQENAPALVPVDLGRLLREVAARSERELLGRIHTLRIVDPELPVILRSDRESLLQVAGNLLDNAVKYTPEGGRVELRYGADGGRAWFEVEDTGIGIPEPDLERIFERFYRIDKARSREVGGTGLGLSIVKHLVAALDGTITVRSEVGRGSCFRVELPRAD